MRIEYVDKITREHANLNPRWLFIFGDNDMRTGYGGLAKELRGCKNAVGIRVKKKPALSADSFYNDNEIEQNTEKICTDINKIIDLVNGDKYDKIIYPKNGIGTGLANMKYRCPETFNYMNLVLEGTLEIRNGNHVKKE